MRIGYIRVSTTDQNTEFQREAIERANCELIFEDKMTGTKAKKTVVKPLTQKIKTRRYGCCMEAGPVGAFTHKPADLLQTFKQKNIKFLSLTEGINTDTSMGRFTFHIMSALAEMERDMIIERTRAGPAIARKRPNRWSPPNTHRKIGRRWGV